ncbi:MAG: DUF2975 domain-containing protein [Patescibacteria group bacterium]
MNKGSTLFLKAVIIVFGLAVLALCIFAFPHIYRGMALEWPGIKESQPFAFVGLYLSAIPFFIALYQGLKLLTYIDKNTAFSQESVNALKTIKYCAGSMTLCYVFIMPLAFFIADGDDAPGLILFAMTFVCSPLIIATFAGVLQKLLQNVVDIKKENELTV